MLQANAVGCVGNDSEIYATQNGTSVLNFSVATQVYQDGEQKTQWVQCSLFGTRADSLEEYIKKGCYVAVSGRLTMGGYESKNDGWVSTLNINVQEITLCGKPSTQQDNKPAQKTQPSKPAGNNQRRAYKGK